jgi:hypothetical protein
MTPERRRPERSRQIPGLPAWLEAARVRQKAKIFHELNHDTYKIALLPANASLRGCTGRQTKVLANDETAVCDLVNAVMAHACPAVAFCGTGLQERIRQRKRHTGER